MAELTVGLHPRSKHAAVRQAVDLSGREAGLVDRHLDGHLGLAVADVVGEECGVRDGVGQHRAVGAGVGHARHRVLVVHEPVVHVIQTRVVCAQGYH